MTGQQATMSGPQADMARPPTTISRFVRSVDGLDLHVRQHAPTEADTTRLPVICLPGLTRTADDFTTLAHRLSTHPERPRIVLAMDLRGRGRSQPSPDWRSYTIPIEAGDVLTVLNHLRIERAIFVGTSRGGLVTLALAAQHAERIGGVVFNDIGPVLEPEGLRRIQGYVGRLAAPASWSEAADMLKQRFGVQFPALSQGHWLGYAHRTWHVAANGTLAISHDTALRHGLAQLDLSVPMPPLWPLFEALAGKPLVVMRGELSDLLSAATCDEMARRHPGCEILTLPGQGHAPLMEHGLPAMETMFAAIDRCCVAADRAAHDRA